MRKLSVRGRQSSPHQKVKYGARSLKFIWAPVYSCTHWLRPRNRGLQRDVVSVGWPIAPSYMSPNTGEGGRELRGLSKWVQLVTRAQINLVSQDRRLFVTAWQPPDASMQPLQASREHSTSETQRQATQHDFLLCTERVSTGFNRSAGANPLWSTQPTPAAVENSA